MYRQGKYDEALPYYTEALEGRRRILGDEHPSTLAWIGNMGNLLYMEGKYDDALPYYTEAFEGYRRVLGSEHPSTVNAVNALLKVYRALDAANPGQGYAEKAEALRQDSLDFLRTLPTANQQVLVRGERVGEFFHGDESHLGAEGSPEVLEDHHVVEALAHFGRRPGGLSPVSSSGE